MHMNLDNATRNRELRENLIESNEQDGLIRPRESRSFEFDRGNAVTVQREVERNVDQETATYGRHLSWKSAYIMIISRIIGSGIFAAPGAVVKSAGGAPMSILVWLGAGAITACALAVSLEYACMLPRSGGDKVYLEFTYRRPRFLVSTIITVSALVHASTANNCIVFGKYLIYSFGVEPTYGTTKLLALMLLSGAGILHSCALEAGVRIQNFIGWFKIGLMLFMLGTAIVVSVLGTASPKKYEMDRFPLWTSLTTRGLWDDSNWSWPALSIALIRAISAYGGYDNANNVLNEVRDPIGMMKTVGPLALLSACILYLLINIAFFVVIPLEEAKKSGELIAGLFFARVFGQRIGRTILPILIAISIMGNVMVAIYSYARLNQEIARQGFLPRFLASSRPFNAPMGGVIVVFIPTFLIIAFYPPGDIYTFILDVQGYPAQIIALALVVGILTLRRNRPELTRPFKAWYLAIILRLGFCVAFVIAPFLPVKDDKPAQFGLWHGAYAIVGSSLLVIAVIYWFVWAVALPYLWGYQLEERTGTMSDGTTYIHIEKKRPLHRA